MRTLLLQLLHLHPGEFRSVARVVAVGLAYAAATSLGDDIAQSIFVSRVGAEQLARAYLLTGAFDVVAAAIYVPLARSRSPGRVLRLAFGIYIAVVIGAHLLVRSPGTAPAYALYVGHEAALQILTIHWGVYVLHVFNASQARRLFPLLFTTKAAGGVLAGLLLGAFVVRVGAAQMLWLPVAFATCAALLSLLDRKARIGTQQTAPPATDSSSGPPDSTDEPDASATLLGAWRQAIKSPLVRTIAASTAAMVLLRYGLKLVSLSEIKHHFSGDEDRIAAFLGYYMVIANGAAVLLGLLFVPRLLARAGIRTANLVYAAATVACASVLVVAPSIGAAVAARFVNQQLKHALKTPLSALFYGAEPGPARAPARAFVFGAVIPLATLAAAGTYELCARTSSPATTASMVALGLAALFVPACAWQNQAWRARLVELLRWKLARSAETGRSEHPAEPLPELAAHRTTANSALLDEISRGLAGADARTRAVAAEVLAETIPRRRAHQIAANRLPGE